MICRTSKHTGITKPLFKKVSLCSERSDLTLSPPSMNTGLPAYRLTGLRPSHVILKRGRTTVYFYILQTGPTCSYVFGPRPRRHLTIYVIHKTHFGGGGLNLNRLPPFDHKKRLVWCPPMCRVSHSSMDITRRASADAHRQLCTHQWIKMS